MSSTIQSITSAIPSLGRARLLISSADDVVIVSAVRTPVTRVSQHPFTFSFLALWDLSSFLFDLKDRGQTPFPQIIIRPRATLMNRPRRVDSKIVYPKTYSPQYSRRPSLGQRSTPQRSGECSLTSSSCFISPFASIYRMTREGETEVEGEISIRANNSDIAVGNVLPPGGGANVARMAQLYSGIPYT